MDDSHNSPSRFGRIWWGATDEAPPPEADWHDIDDCHEWDGLFSMSAGSGSQETLLLTAWCDNSAPGSFEFSIDGVTALVGATRVLQAPELREEDGYTFPAGAYFGAGYWIVECIASSGTRYVVHARIHDWNSTD